MKILWLSWRDIKNPKSGGAEKVTFEILRRIAKDTHKVTLFTSQFSRLMPEEKLDGFQIIRRGNEITSRFHAITYYLKNKPFDLVVDEINTLPHLSPLFVKGKKIAFFHQIAKEYWFSQSPFPINIAGYLLEPIYLRLYRNTKTLTVSKSTKEDLENLGFKKVSIVREGLDLKPYFYKNKKTQILFLGRLVPAKGPKDALFAFQKIALAFPSYRLIIAGRGEKNYEKKLKKITKGLGLAKKVRFLGYVNEKTKKKLLKESKLILIPGIREGWGLTATEAMSQGTVPIAYNVPGLKDAISNGKTGILTNNNPNSLAKAAINLLHNEKVWHDLAKNGANEAKKFSWNNTYLDFKKTLTSL